MNSNFRHPDSSKHRSTSSYNVYSKAHGDKFEDEPVYEQCRDEPVYEQCRAEPVYEQCRAEPVYEQCRVEDFCGDFHRQSSTTHVKQLPSLPTSTSAGQSLSTGPRNDRKVELPIFPDKKDKQRYCSKYKCVTTSVIAIVAAVAIVCFICYVSNSLIDFSIL